MTSGCTPGCGRGRRLDRNVDILVHGGARDRHRDVHHLQTQRMQVSMRHSFPAHAVIAVHCLWRDPCPYSVLGAC